MPMSKRRWTIQDGLLKELNQYCRKLDTTTYGTDAYNAIWDHVAHKAICFDYNNMHISWRRCSKSYWKNDCYVWCADDWHDYYYTDTSFWVYQDLENFAMSWLDEDHEERVKRNKQGGHQWKYMQ